MVTLPLAPLLYAFALVSSLYIVHLGLYLIAANFYDIWHHRRKQRTRALFAGPGAQAAKRAKPPLVSVIISAHNEEKVIVRTLDSLRQSTYPNTEFLIADDASADCTSELVRAYKARHRTMHLRLYRMRRNVGKGGALNTLLRRYVKGTFVMTLDADSTLLPDTISNAISYFDDPTIAGVAANVRIMDEPTVIGVLQKLEHMTGYRSKKLYSLLNCEFVVGGVASTYRMETLRQVDFYDTDTQTEDIGLSIKIVSLGNRAHRLIYAADVVAMTEGVPTFRALIKQRFRWKYGSLQNLIKYRHLFLNPNSRYSRALTFYRLPMALISELVLLATPIIWGYLLYMTLTNYDPMLFIGAYSTITLYILIIIWFDEHLHTVGRLRLSAYALVSYFMFYMMDVVQLIGIIRCLYRTKSLALQQNTGSTWVSPQRVGRKVRHQYES